MGSSTRYHQKNKERLQKRANKTNEDLSKKEQEKKSKKIILNDITNLPKDEKQRLVEYRKKYSKCGE